jgi:YVTN family beta-propeller protein
MLTTTSRSWRPWAAILTVVALCVGPTVSPASAAVNGVLSTTTVGSVPSAVAVATVSGITVAYVTNSADDTVSVINTSTHAVLDTITVGDDPRGVAINPAGTVAYVTNFGADTVSVINTTTRVVTNTISVGDGPWGVAFSTTRALAFVANSLADTVSMIDTATLADVVAPIVVGDDPRGIASDASGNFALVVSYGSDNLKVINTFSNAVQSTQPTGDGPTSVASVSGSIVVVTNSLEDSVSTHDFSGRTQKGTSVIVGDDPRGIVVAVGGLRGYVTNFGDGTVNYLSLSTTDGGSKFPTPISVGTNPYGVAINPGHTRVYVANSGSSSVSEIEILPPYQSFTFSLPDHQTGTTGTFTLANPAANSTANATAVSTGNPVVVSSSTTSVCTVSGRVVTKLMAGTCTLTATAAAATVGAFFYPALSAGPHSFFIRAPAGPQTVTFPALVNVLVGARPTLVATASGTVTFATQTPSICTVTAPATLVAVAVGTCTVKATAAAVTTGPVLWLAGEATTSWEITQAAQTITFASPGTQPSYPATFSVTATNSAPLPVVVSGSTNSVCTVSGSTVTRVSNGTCTLTATAASGTVSFVTYPAATPVTHSFSIEDATQTITFDSPGTQIGSSGTFTVTATSSAGLPVVVSGSTDSVCTVSGFTVTKVSPGTCNLTANAAAGLVGPMPYSAASVTRATLIAPTPIPTPTSILARTSIPTPTPVTPPLRRGGTDSSPPSQPTALVGGLSVPVNVEVKNPNTMVLGFRNVSLELQVASGQGSALSQGGTTQLQVMRGASAGFKGSGLLPRSTVQVFMSVPGSDARGIAQIPVDASGAFSGDAIAKAMALERPLPIGRHVLQMVMVDADGRQTILELTIGILQPPPAPELDPAQGSRPTLRPGQSMATNAGQPDTVTVTANADRNQATVVGDGWSMSIRSDGGSGGAESSGKGAVVVTLVRGQGTTVSGDGFMPGTRADVWLFSNPTLVGTVEIDKNGKFSGVVTIDGKVVAAGEHTLQLQGVGADGNTRAANLGVSVVDEAPPVFVWWWLLLAVVPAVLLFALWRRRAAR